MKQKTEAVAKWCSVKIAFLKILQIHRKIPVVESPINKVAQIENLRWLFLQSS